MVSHKPIGIIYMEGLLGVLHLYVVSASFGCSLWAVKILVIIL